MIWASSSSLLTMSELGRALVRTNEERRPEESAEEEDEEEDDEEEAGGKAGEEEADRPLGPMLPLSAW